MSESVPNDGPVRGGRSNAGLAREILEWERRFVDCCNDEPAAKRALDRLEQTGLGAACKKLLWEYSSGPEAFAEMQRGIALIVHNLRAFDRAERVWKSKSNDPRAQMYRERFENAARVLMQTPWPFRNPVVPTFGDRFRLTPSANLFDLRRIGALVGRSKLSYMLAILRAGTKAHSVDLSANEIAALAYCASGENLDAGAVRRFFREPWIPTAETGYRAIFDNLIASV